MSDPRQQMRANLRRFRKVVRRSRRYWPVYLGVVVLASLAAGLAPQVLEPVYRSQAVLVYRELVPTSALMDRDAPVESPRQRGSRLREMLMARSNLEQLITELDLYPEIVATRGLAEAVDELLEDADCRVGEDTFTIRFEYRHPELAQRMVAEMAQSLVEQSTRYRLETARSTTKFLEAQRDRTKEELVAKEEALAQFLAAHPEFAQDVMMQAAGGPPAGASIRAQERKQAMVTPAVEALERQRMRLLNRIRAIDEGKPVPLEPTTPGLDPAVSGAIHNGEQELARAEQELQDLLSRYTEKHPDVRRARSRVASASAALAAARSAASSIEVPARASAPPLRKEDRRRLSAQLARVEASLDTARRRVASDSAGESTSWIVDLETEWAALHRDVRDVRERYQQMQRHFFQASILDHIEAAGGASHMTVVDPAFLPDKPARRAPHYTAAGAALVVLLLGAALALGLAYIDDRLYDLDDLKGMELTAMLHPVPPASSRGDRG